MNKRVLVFLVALLAASAAPAAQDVSRKAADEYCMAINIYYEARSENEQGKRAVAYVTQNRGVKRHQNLCRVVFAYKQFSWVHQYKVLDENKHIKAEFRPRASSAQWKECLRIAREVMAHPEQDLTKGAEFFVAYYIYPRCLSRACKWIKRLEFVGQFDSHLFFREARRDYFSIPDPRDIPFCLKPLKGVANVQT